MAQRVTGMGEVGDRPLVGARWAQPVIPLREYSWLDQTQCFDSAVYDSAWNGLINDMLRELNDILTGTGVRFELRQIKEKLGTLRCYYRLPDASDEIRAAVADIYDRAVFRSVRTCLDCGAPAVIASHKGWIGPLCPRHAAAR